MRRLRTFRVLRRWLPIAGRDGTLADRMRSAPNDVLVARRLQDRMVQAIAGYDA